MRPLARSSLPFFDSATPSPSLLASSAAPTPPRTLLTLEPPTARIDSATFVVPAVEGRPVSLSASVLLHGGSGDRARAVGAGPLEEREVLVGAGQGRERVGPRLEGSSSRGVPVDGEPGSAAESGRRHQRFSTYTTKCLDELRTADDGILTAWTTGFDATAAPPTSASSPDSPSEARLAPPSPHIPSSDSSHSLGSFTHLDGPSLARTPHSSTSTGATTTSRSSCSRSVFSPSRWRRTRASQGARVPSPAPPTPPRPRAPLHQSSPAPPPSTRTIPAPAAAGTLPRVVRFAPPSPRSASPSRPSHRRAPSPPSPGPDWHLISTSRLRSDPNAQGQGLGAPPPREPGAWARWTAPRPVVRAWERGDEGLGTAARVSPRVSAGGRPSARGRRGATELSWGERVRRELDRAADAAAAAVDEEQDRPD